MADVTDVDLLSTLHYTFQARPHHSNLMSGFFNVPCLTKLLINAEEGTYGLFVLIREDQNVYPFLDIVEKQHILLGYIQTLSVGLARAQTLNFLHNR